MRRLIKIALVALGIRAFLRWRKRRKAESIHTAATQPETDPAEELRRKLAESRGEGPVGEPAPMDADAATVDERRAQVHEQGRATLGEMSSTGEG